MRTLAHSFLTKAKSSMIYQAKCDSFRASALSDWVMAMNLSLVYSKGEVMGRTTVYVVRPQNKRGRILYEISDRLKITNGAKINIIIGSTGCTTKMPTLAKICLTW